MIKLLYAKVVFLILFVIGFDQFSKWVVLNFFPNIVFMNENGALGILPWWGGVIGLIGLGGYLVRVQSEKFKMQNIGEQNGKNEIWDKKKLFDDFTFYILFIIFAAGVSNVIDRIVYGGVVDFIAIWIFPVFNIADAIISVGAGLLLWREFVGGQEDKEE